MSLFKRDKGIQFEHSDILGYHVRMATVSSEEAGKKLGRAVGKYYTIELERPLHKLLDMRDLSECLARILDSALEPLYGKRILICGLGNENDPADALGPEVSKYIPLRLISDFYRGQGRFEEVFAFTPGVAMLTNLATEKLVKGMVDATDADGVILVDSVATSEYGHLYRLIDISTAGGFTSHLANVKADWSELGVPIISIGVPTAVPGSTLFPGEAGRGSIFTESNVGEVMSSARAIITYALIRTCWPTIPPKQCYALSKFTKDPTALLGAAYFGEGGERG